MKKLYILPLALFMLVLASCSKDFLESPQYDKVVSDYVFRNEANVMKGLYGVYDALPGDWLWAPMSHFANFLALDCQAGGWDISWTTHEFNSDFSYLQQMWYTCYQGVDRTNRFLLGMNSVDPAIFTKVDQNVVAAEARALRAWYYLNLAMAFSEVGNTGSELGPVLLMEGETYSNMPEKARATKAETYDFIISELQFAKSKLGWEPWSDPYLKNAKQYGRVTKGMCIAYEALAQMTVGNYAAAAPLWRELIDNGMYGLEPYYKNIHQINYNFGTESIWEVAYPAVADAGTWDGETNVRHWTKIKTGGQVVSGTGGWGSIYISNEWVAAFENGLTTADERLLGSIVPAGGTNPYTGEAVKSGYNQEGLSYNALLKYWKEKCGYYKPNMYVSQPHILMRLGEVYMYYAECLYRTVGADTEVSGLSAWKCLDVLRNRAYGNLHGAGVTVPEAKTYYTALRASKGYTKFTDFEFGLIWERRRESLNEYSLWYNFQRLGYDATNEFLVKEYGQRAMSPSGAPDFFYGKTMDTYRMTFPIPLQECQRNSLIVQNEGYAAE
ncbi:MAG: RagB/SusD family nutrient uptake outer membrane protein [Bacteroidales bacterium]|nr:RagB/SusD family nutrient uptake outer membrane protein [Bacteroidales bacterium]